MCAGVFSSITDKQETYREVYVLVYMVSYKRA